MNKFNLIIIKKRIIIIKNIHFSEILETLEIYIDILN